jgi:hypothetical protein
MTNQTFSTPASRTRQVESKFVNRTLLNVMFIALGLLLVAAVPAGAASLSQPIVPD